MLDTMQVVDLLEVIPDVDGLDLFSPTFVWNLVPPAIGCYAFYHPVTGEIWYVGSACTSSYNKAQHGLRNRMRNYRGSGPNTKLSIGSAKVHAACRNHGLLVKIWTSLSVGDCRKYEADTIQKHCPRLNIHCAKSRSIEDQAEFIRRKSRESGRRNAEHPFDPDALKTCIDCKIEKPCRDFPKNSQSKLGCRARCKECYSNGNTKHTIAAPSFYK